jgi:hypothetical protein
LVLSGWRWGRVAIAIVIASVTPCAGADETTALMTSFAQTSRELLRGDRTYHLDEVQLDAQGIPRRGDRLRRRPGVDVSPALDAVFGFFNHHGVPLREQRDDSGGSLVGVQAAFSVGRDLPAVNFNLGDRPVEPLGAFYSAERGFRCAVVWPIERFTLRLEGGEDSEFGYYGIAGVQWLHPRLPLAIGAGIPMNLRDANGDVGVIVQFRMRLD